VRTGRRWSAAAGPSRAQHAPHTTRQTNGRMVAQHRQNNGRITQAQLSQKCQDCQSCQSAASERLGTPTAPADWVLTVRDCLSFQGFVF